MPSGVLDFPDISEVYARFAALMELSADLGGWLLLFSGLDRGGIAVAMASNVAGAASLGIEPDAELAKRAMRAGVCDFLVNNLDEALRILKNEIRKRRPVSVALASEVSAAVAEMVKRGVQPEVLTFPVREMMERGARVLSTGAEGALTPMTWSAEGDAVRSLPVVDALAIASLQDGAPLKAARSRWLAASPRYLGRAFAGQRFVEMTGGEADAFVAAVRAGVDAGTIPDAVRVVRGGAVVSMGA